MTAFALAFHRAGIKTKRTHSKIKWPRVKGPRGKRIDCRTGHMVGVTK